MKIAPKDQLSLLALAELQTKVSSLPARLRALPERDRLETLQAEMNDQRNSAAKSKLNVADTDLELNRLESDLEKLNRREQADRRSLGAAEDIDARRDLQHDLDATYRRRKELLREIDEKRHMRKAHAINTQANDGDLAERVRYAEKVLRDAEIELEEDAGAAQAEIEARREALPDELVKLYDSIAEHNSVPVAKLDGRTCGSCGMELDSATWAEFEAAPADVPCFCPDCGALLIRPVTVAAAQ